MQLGRTSLLVLTLSSCTFIHALKLQVLQADDQDTHEESDDDVAKETAADSSSAQGDTRDYLDLGQGKCMPGGRNPAFTFNNGVEGETKRQIYKSCVAKCDANPDCGFIQVGWISKNGEPGKWCSNIKATARCDEPENIQTAWQRGIWQPARVYQKPPPPPETVCLDRREYVLPPYAQTNCDQKDWEAKDFDKCYGCEAFGSFCKDGYVGLNPEQECQHPYLDFCEELGGNRYCHECGICEDTITYPDPKSTTTTTSFTTTNPTSAHYPWFDWEVVGLGQCVMPKGVGFIFNGVISKYNSSWATKRSQPDIALACRQICADYSNCGFIQVGWTSKNTFKPSKWCSVMPVEATCDSRPLGWGEGGYWKGTSRDIHAPRTFKKVPCDHTHLMGGCTQSQEPHIHEKSFPKYVYTVNEDVLCLGDAVEKCFDMHSPDASLGTAHSRPGYLHSKYADGSPCYDGPDCIEPTIEDAQRACDQAGNDCVAIQAFTYHGKQAFLLFANIKYRFDMDAKDKACYTKTPQEASGGLRKAWKKADPTSLWFPSEPVDGGCLADTA